MLLQAFTRRSERSIGHTRSSLNNRSPPPPSGCPVEPPALLGEPPRQVAQRRARAHTLHARTCRRPSVSCAVNYVHKFHTKIRPHVNGCSRNSEPPQQAESGRTGRRATANIVWNRNADSECSVSVSNTNRLARRLRCRYSTTPKATNGEHLSEGWDFERNLVFLFFLNHFKTFIFLFGVFFL